MSVNSLVHYANEVFGLFTIIKRRFYVTLINDGVIKTSRTSVRSLIVKNVVQGSSKLRSSSNDRVKLITSNEKEDH